MQRRWSAVSIPGKYMYYLLDIELLRLLETYYLRRSFPISSFSFGSRIPLSLWVPRFSHQRSVLPMAATSPTPLAAPQLPFSPRRPPPRPISKELHFNHDLSATKKLQVQSLELFFRFFYLFFSYSFDEQQFDAGWSGLGGEFGWSDFGSQGKECGAG